MTRVLLSAPDVGDLEAKYHLEAIASGWVAPAGADPVRFESEVATAITYIGAQYLAATIRNADRGPISDAGKVTVQTVGSQ